MTDVDTAAATPRPRTPLRADPAGVHERDLTDLVADWRTGRATRSVWQAISNAYVVLFTVVMIGAMIGNVIVQAQVSVAACTTESCVSARTVLPWAAVALSITVALAISRLFGPVLASAAEGFWLLDAPIRRGKVLGRRLFAVVIATTVIAAILGGLVSTLTGSTVTLIIAWTVATGLAAGGSVALAAAQQSRDDSRATRVLGGIFALTSLAAMLVVVGVAARWFSLPVIGDASLTIAAVVGAFGLIVTVLALIAARLRLDRLQRTRLTSGGSLVSGLSGAMYALDLGLMNDILVERRCEQIGNVRSRRAGGTGTGSLVRRDALRLLRFPRPLLTVAVVVMVPYVFDALGLGVVAPLVSAIALFGALVPMLGALRVLSRSGGMSRAMPFNPGQIKRASVVVPAITALVWSLATVPAYMGFGEGSEPRTVPDAMITAYLVAAAGLLGAIRWTIAKPINFSAPMVATQAGALPPGMITNLLRGFDLCVLITAPLMLGLPWLVSLVLAVICAGVLLGSFDMQEMQHRAKTQQAELDKAKAQRAAAKR